MAAILSRGVVKLHLSVTDDMLSIQITFGFKDSKNFYSMNIVLKSISSIFISVHNRRKQIIYGVIIKGLETTIKGVVAFIMATRL